MCDIGDYYSASKCLSRYPLIIYFRDLLLLETILLYNQRSIDLNTFTLIYLVKLYF